MSEQVVVICSAGEQLSAIDLCSKLEDQGLTCWSPVREEDPAAAIWTLPSKLRSARVLLIVTTDPAEHQDAIETAASNRMPVIMAAPDGQASGWGSVMRELADALGLSPDWLSGRAGQSAAQPKTHIAEDEEEHLEYIAENVSEAQVFVRFGLFEHAVKRLQSVFAKAPRNLEAHDELLKIYLEEEEWNKAAGAAADFLDCLRFRGDDQSYDILRTHLVSMGFSVDDGPPVAVGYSDVEPVPTKFFEAGGRPAPAAPAARPAAKPSPAPATPAAPNPKAVEPVALELPALRNFKAANPVFQSSGVDAELSGIDFFIDHGMLDEARMRVDQLAHEHPEHEGVKERLRRIEDMGLSGLKSAIALELDDPWDAAKRATQDAPVDTLFGGGATEKSPFDSQPDASPADGPSGEGDSLVCTAFVPESVEPGDMFVVRVCIHAPEQGGHPMLESQHDRRESNMLARNVEKGRSMTISLTLPGFEIDGDRLRIEWVGEPDSVEFSVVAPFAQGSGSVTGRLSVHTEAGPAGDFSITIPVS